MEVKIKLLDVEYSILRLTSRELSLLTIALLEGTNKEEKDSEPYCHLKEMIDKIEEATSKVNKL